MVGNKTPDSEIVQAVHRLREQLAADNRDMSQRSKLQAHKGAIDKFKENIDAGRVPDRELTDRTLEAAEFLGSLLTKQVMAAELDMIIDPEGALSPRGEDLDSQRE